MAIPARELLTAANLVTLQHERDKKCAQSLVVLYGKQRYLNEPHPPLFRNKCVLKAIVKKYHIRGV